MNVYHDVFGSAMSTRASAGWTRWSDGLKIVFRLVLFPRLGTARLMHTAVRWPSTFTGR